MRTPNLSAESKSVLFGSIEGMLIVVQEEEVEEEEPPRWTQRQTQLFQEPIATLDVSRHKDPAECLVRATTETGKHKLGETSLEVADFNVASLTISNTNFSIFLFHS